MISSPMAWKVEAVEAAPEWFAYQVDSLVGGPNARIVVIIVRNIDQGERRSQTAIGGAASVLDI